MKRFITSELFRGKVSGIFFSVPAITLFAALPLYSAGSLPFLSHAVNLRAIAAIVFLIIIIYSALHDGIRIALLSSVIAYVYFLLVYAIPGQPFHYTTENIWRIAIIGVTLFALSIIIGHYRQEVQHIFEAERQRRKKAEMLARKLQRTNTRKVELIGIASHELKTPLTSIKLTTQALQKKVKKVKSTQQVEPYVAHIDKQVNSLTRIVTNMLDLSKIATGKFPLNKETFDLDALIVEKISDIQKISPTHHIVKKGHIKRKINADRLLISQVITNLLTNAIKYSSPGQKIIVMVNEKNNMLTLNVNDFGIGIAKKHTKKIFERFYQVGASGGKRSSGLGIGLYISRQIIKQHGGTITVRSKENEGSTFSLSLPQ